MPVTVENYNNGESMTSIHLKRYTGEDNVR